MKKVLPIGAAEVNTYNIEQVKDFSFFNKNVYIDKKFLLSIPECPITAEMRTAIKNWDFELIYSEGEPAVFQSSKTEVIDFDTGEKSVITVDKDNDAALERVKQHQETMKRVEEKIGVFSETVDKIFSNYTIKKTLELHTVSDAVKEIYEFTKENKKLILRADLKYFGESQNYILPHSLRTTILAIIIGIQLKMPAHKLIELGIASILHEIGMLRLPPKYYMYKTPLSEDGKKAILTHPVLSYSILKSSGFPMPVCLGVLEHHEREDGSGYPRGLTKEKISVYAKIIAVACSYEAATGCRPYKEAANGAAILIDMLKNQSQQYDDTILKALLFSLSFYPIGIYVLLSNGKAAQVVDINPDDPRYPIVQIYEQNPSGSPKIMGTDKDGVYIKKPLTKDEINRLKQGK